MIRVLRAGAFLSIGVGALTALFMLWTNWPFSLRDYAVGRKYVSPSGSTVQYRLYCEVSPGGSAYDSTYPQSFYEAAHEGDRLRTTMNGYSILVRDGRVIKRYVSEDLLIPVLYCLIAFLPAVAFVRVASRLAQWACYVAAGLAEIIAIGGFLVSLLAPC